MKQVKQMKISEIETSDVATYLRLDDEYDDTELEGIMAAVESYISSYTGLKSSTAAEEGEDNLDNYEDLYVPYMILCQDAYDNRQFTVDNANENKAVQSILSLHSRNLL